MCAVRALRPDILPLQILITRACRSTFIFPMAPDIVAILSRIRFRQLIIAPMPHETHPAHGMTLVVRCKISMPGFMNGRGVVLELVHIGLQGRVPERTAITEVHEDTDGEIEVWDR